MGAEWRGASLKTQMESLETAVLKYTADVGAKVLSSAVLATPVDSGLLRGSWKVQANSPSSSLGSKDKGGGATISKGVSVLFGLKKVGVVYISNNVEYAGHVEAWAGMARMAVARGSQ